MRRMSRDQRVKGNWALLHACEEASKTNSGVAVAFNLVCPSLFEHISFAAVARELLETYCLSRTCQG